MRFPRSEDQLYGSFRPLADTIGNIPCKVNAPSPTRTAPTALPYVPG
jgi:hypothetical protein